jgi:stage V sporulation protein SpoVS
MTANPTDAGAGMPSLADRLRQIAKAHALGDSFVDQQTAETCREAAKAFEAKEREIAAVAKVKHYLAVSEVEDPFAAMIDECEAMEARALSAEAKLAQAVEALSEAREYVVDALNEQEQNLKDVAGYPGLMKREQARLDQVREDLARIDRARTASARGEKT